VLEIKPKGLVNAGRVSTLGSIPNPSPRFFWVTLVDFDIVHLNLVIWKTLWFIHECISKKPTSKQKANQNKNRKQQ
jgi:hypothetical protein